MSSTKADSVDDAKLAEKLAKVNLKQDRFLGHDTHSYEHFSLPVSRVSFWVAHTCCYREINKTLPR